jgi:hypothetical protein
MRRVRNLIKNREGTAVPLAAAIALSLILIFCVISEYFRISIITQGVRDAVQQSVISVVNDNYDDAYHSIREGYSAGYVPVDGGWEESLDTGDVYSYLTNTLGLVRENGSYRKYAGDELEFTLSDLKVDLKNAPLMSDSGDQLLAEVSLELEVPVRIGRELLPPMRIQLVVQAEYSPIF